MKDPFAFIPALAKKAKVTPPPPPTKTIPGPRVPLPSLRPNNRLARTLRARRTWRSFSKRPLTRSQIATLLQLTWGVQKRITIVGQGKFVLKTSPSAGARHPIEAYLIALNVKGLDAGVYHYAAGDHHLVNLERRVSRSLMARLLGNQGFLGEAAAFVVMSAMFRRTLWKYHHSRAYRVILAEAGHLAQTFCLVATELRLAPFCTMAFRDTGIEKLIGVDGVDEAALYVVGVGGRPRGVKVPGQIPGRVPSVIPDTSATRRTGQGPRRR